MTRTAQPSRLVSVLPVGAALLLVNTVLTSSEPPAPDDTWRWFTVLSALALATWNVQAAYRAYERTGLLSVIGFFHLWALFSFSFPAFEMTYRYSRIGLGYWSTATDDPVLLRTVLMLAVFQAVFFLTLGGGTETAVSARLRSSRNARPDLRVALAVLVLLLPLLAARLSVLRGLGLSGIAESMVTRTDYFERLTDEVNPLLWVLNTLFPIFAVSLMCLVVKYLVPHPTQLGRMLFLGTLLLSAAGVALSGGRAEIVYVLVTVLAFMHVAGYRSTRQLAPVGLALALVAVLLVLVAQARTGEDNALTRLAGDPTVGRSYQQGDVTQLLGLGRFDALTMILERHDPADDLDGKSYAYALAGGLNTSFIPRVAYGSDLPTFHISDEVLGPWIFGGATSSALPSAPGELYLNFGWPGVLLGAAAIGLALRLLLRGVVKLPGPLELAFVLVLWTSARMLSDESYLIATFIMRNWLAALALTVLLASATVAFRLAAEEPVPEPEPDRPSVDAPARLVSAAGR